MLRPQLLIALALPLSMLACKRDQHAYSEQPYSDQPSTWQESSGGSASVAPRQVCEHLAQLIAAEIGPVDPAVQAATIDECTIEMVQEQQLRGPQDWDNISSCVINAYNEADIDRCDQLFPAQGAQPQPQVGTREDEACVFMITMILVEAGGTAALSDAELEGMHQECLTAFAEDRAAMSSAEYDGLVNCIFAATTVAQMEQCGG